MMTTMTFHFPQKYRNEKNEVYQASPNCDVVNVAQLTKCHGLNAPSPTSNKLKSIEVIRNMKWKMEGIRDKINENS